MKLLDTVMTSDAPLLIHGPEVERLARFRGGYPELRAEGIEALTTESHVRYLSPASFDDRLTIRRGGAKHRGICTVDPHRLCGGVARRRR